MSSAPQLLNGLAQVPDFILQFGHPNGTTLWPAPLGTAGRKPVGFAPKPCGWNWSFRTTNFSSRPWARRWNWPSFVLQLLPHVFSLAFEVLGRFGHSGGAQILDGRD